VITK